MKTVIEIVLLWVILLLPFKLQAEDLSMIDRQVIENHIDRFMGGKVKQSRIEKAKALIDDVIEVSQEFQVDPLIVAVTITAESSWLPEVTGRRGEVGLMQVHGRALKDAGNDDSVGYLRAGVKWMAFCLSLADSDVKRAFAIYMTGNPKARSFKASLKRWKAFKELSEERYNIIANTEEG